jgi:hypothetical protein
VVDEHGRFERRRRVPDVLERERRQKSVSPEKPMVDASPAHGDADPTLAAGADADGPLAPSGEAPKVPDAGFWTSLEGRRRLVIACALVAGVLAIAGLAWGAWWLANLPEPTTAPVRSAPFVPSAVPSASVGATGSVTTSGSVGATGSATATSALPTGPRAPVRAPLIVYRAGGAVWVSGEHGGTPRSVYPAPGAGVFALSPDGLVLAYVDAAAGVLRLIDLTSARNTPVGPALALRPDWAPDSSFVTYTRPAGAGRSEEVCRVAASGGTAVPIVKGWKGRVMAGGSTVAAAPPPPLSPTGPVALLSDGRKVTLVGTARSDEVCPDIGGVFWVELGAGGDGDSAALPSIRWVRWDGKGSRTVVARPIAAARVAFAGLTLSPDGKWLVYAETGDDGYSRLFAVPAVGGAPVTLSPRLDGYAMNWSADGAELFFVEGNAIQGEATRVSAVHPDGTAHRIVVEGGGL